MTRRLRALWALPVWACLLFAPVAHAGFIGGYSLGNFALTNSNADGSVFSPDGGQTLILTGGNNGSGLAGSTDFLVVVPIAGLIQFHYNYAAADLPGFDRGGFVANGLFSPLADTDGRSGVSQFVAAAGMSFGFRVATDDNTGEPGILTITDFTAPGAAQSVPEPAFSAALAFAVAAMAARRHGPGPRLSRRKAE
jgi:hypothetical protein